MLLNTRDFAHKVGEQTRLTLNASLPFHQAYMKADTEQRAEMRLDWCIGYIGGRENVSAARAAKIWEAGKGNEAIDAGAVDRAAKSFNHHVVRSSPKTEERGGQKRVRLPAGCVERIASAYAGLTKAQIIEAHKRALAALSFE